jgi:predicted RNA-binding Zn-ribbon protein involved in translation (DUF1610 family)
MDKKLEAIAHLQKKIKLPCPRCGADNMEVPVYKNASSRHEEVYICGDCGVGEAARDFARLPPLPLEKWAYNEIVTD